MQVSSISYSNGRIRSAVPLEESQNGPLTSARNLKHISETRLSRVEMDKEESVHDDLIFEYSNKYRAFSGRARKSQNAMTIRSSDEENTDDDADDFKENRLKSSRQNRTKSSNQHNDSFIDDYTPNSHKNNNKNGKSEQSNRKKSSYSNNNEQISDEYDEEIELDEKRSARKETSLPKG